MKKEIREKNREYYGKMFDEKFFPEGMKNELGKLRIVFTKYEKDKKPIKKEN